METIMPNESDSRTIPDGPLSMVRELPPGPVEQCTTEELTNFVANISLFTRGKEPQEQERRLDRMSEALDELKARGIPFVEMAHWNFGPDSRRNAVPPNDTRYDPDWYKRNPRKRGLLGRLREVFR
jgi:hypothetical protein